jgi:hypothetical protein
MMVDAPGSSSPPPAAPDWASAGRSVAIPQRASSGVRLGSGFAALAAATVLVIAWILTPSEDGLGTHQQMGLPPCNWIVAANMPCPTCGMTTAFSFAAHGNLLESFRTQPLGALLAVMTAMVVLIGGWTAVSGSMIAPFFSGMFGKRLLWVFVAMLLVAWIYKIGDHREYF